VLRPGQHGSTFGGNPLACAVGREVVAMLATGEYQQRARELGAHLHRELRALLGCGVVAVRGLGLWAGIDVDPRLGSGRTVCERLLARGVLAKDTHGATIRLAPPLVVEADELTWAVEQLRSALAVAA
jgi:ornithine--oxo-acid transaminase